MSRTDSDIRKDLTGALGHSLTRAMAGPLAILILIPVLVCGIGLTITLVSFSSSRDNIERVATESFMWPALPGEGRCGNDISGWRTDWHDATG